MQIKKINLKKLKRKKKKKKKRGGKKIEKVDRQDNLIGKTANGNTSRSWRKAGSSCGQVMRVTINTAMNLSDFSPWNET